jgi:MFS family permease
MTAAPARNGTATGRGSGGRPGRQRLGRPFWRLWTTTLIGSAGDGLRLAALPLTAALFTRDPLLLSLVTFAGQLPWILAGPLAGAYADRHDHRQTMLVADTVRAGLAAGFTLLLFTGHGSLAAIVLFTLAMGCLETLRDSATLAVLPRLAPEPQLDKANSLLQGAAMLCVELTGPPLAALLLAVGTAWPYALDSASFAVSALLLVKLTGTTAPRRDGPPRSLAADVREGMRWLWRHRLLRTVCVLTGAFNFALSTVVSVAVLYAYDVLGVGSVAYGLLMAVIAVGALAGVAGAPALARRLGRERTLLLFCATTALALAAAGTTSHPLAAAGMLSTVGMALAVITVVTTSLRQALVPAGLLGRVGSSYRLVAVGMSPLGALAGGLSASSFGLRAPFFLAAAVLALTWALALPVLARATKGHR